MPYVTGKQEKPVDPKKLLAGTKAILAHIRDPLRVVVRQFPTLPAPESK